MKHQTSEGQAIVLDEPLNKEQIASLLPRLLEDPNTSQILVKKLTPEQLLNRVRAWFIKFLDDEDEIVLSEALFKEKNESLWPYDLIATEDLPDECIESETKLATWLWDHHFTHEQRLHISTIKDILD